MRNPPRSRRTLARAVVAGAAAAAVAALPAIPAAAAPYPGPSGSGSGSTSASASPQAGLVAGSTTYTIGELNDLDSNNPFAAQVDLSYEVLGDTYDLLEGWSQKDFAPVPGLATSWKPSGDGLTWTFTIRSGVKWSDGQPMTAADVAYTFNRAVNDPTANGIDYTTSRASRAWTHPTPRPRCST